MKQLALDIGLASLPTLDNFFAGPNEAVVSHLRLWTTGGTRSPVPTYLWGEGGSGKTHLLQSLAERWQATGQRVAWYDADTALPWELPAHESLLLLDDCQRFDAGK